MLWSPLTVQFPTELEVVTGEYNASKAKNILSSLWAILFEEIDTGTEFSCWTSDDFDSDV